MTERASTTDRRALPPPPPPPPRDGLEGRMERFEERAERLDEKLGKLDELGRAVLTALGDTKVELREARSAFIAAKWIATPIWLGAMSLSWLALKDVWQTITAALGK